MRPIRRRSPSAERPQSDTVLTPPSTPTTTATTGEQNSHTSLLRQDREMASQAKNIVVKIVSDNI